MTPTRLPIDHTFDTEFADELARLESYNKNLYRPNTYLHKWWARRCGTTFRAILKQLVEGDRGRDYYAPGGLEGTIILDPMMGGGTTLHEAIRLGANVIGADIDPIPILQARATLSDMPLAQLETAFARFHEALHTALAPFYRTACPTCHSTVDWQFMLYGLQKQCACQNALFVDSLTLRHNNDGTRTHLCPETQDILLDGAVISEAVSVGVLPLRDKGESRCERCGQPFVEELSVPFYQRYMPYAVVGECQAHGLFFAAPDEVIWQALAQAEACRELLGFDAAAFAIDPLAPESKRLARKGIHSYLDLFSSRQLLFLHQAIELLPGFDPLERLNLALIVSTSLEFNSMLCGYKGMNRRRAGAIRHTFTQHSYSFPYTVLENNPLHPDKRSGTLTNLFHWRVVRGREWANAPVERRHIGASKPEQIVIAGERDGGSEVPHPALLQQGHHRFYLHQGSSIALPLPDESVDFIVTDPPYYDSVQYSDLATFFLVWLRQLLPNEATWEYALDGAAVDPMVNGNGQYTAVLSRIFAECRRVLKKDRGRVIFTFHHWNPKGWAAITIALQRAGFVLVNRYVVHAENYNSVHIVNQNALVHDVILVLAPSTSTTTPAWEQPQNIRADNSHDFCYDCGTLVGHLLQTEMSEVKLQKLWQRLLN